MKYLKLYEDFEDDSFNDSVIKDSDGKLLELYHGTNINFDSFDEEYQLNGWLGKGFYFTEKRKYAKENGKYIKKVNINMKNPFYPESNSPSELYSEVNKLFNPDKTDIDEISYLLKKNGYDGVVYTHWDSDIGKMYSVFYPNQIKILVK